MTDTIKKVLKFHEAFGCTIGEAPFGLASVNDWDLTAAAESLRWAMVHAYRGAKKGDERCMRIALLAEELHELAEAMSAKDSADTLDALVDLRYVLDGTVIAFGLHRRNLVSAEGTMTNAFEVAFDRVHDANMSKLHDGIAVHDSTGKVVKPAGWVAADLSDLVV